VSAEAAAPPDDVRLPAPGSAVEVTGPPDGPRLVFIHGSRLTGSSWRAVTRRLEDTYRCLCPDLPAHGARADQRFTIDAAVDVVDAAIAAEDGRPAILIGLSLGGYVAIAAAARAAEQAPGRVRGLVLAGCTAEPSGRAAAAFRLFAWALGTAPEEPFDALNTWFFRHRYPPEIAEPIVAGGYWSRGGASAVRALGRTNFRHRLLAYGGPILVINGDLDLVFRLGESSFLEGVPHVSRRVLSWTTHLSPLDRPDAFAAAIRAFEGRLPG
jgi:pimeloyl-ACP methyl ester carboxylesterase